MSTYAIRCTATGRVKIGKSKNPHSRLRELQTGASAPLELVGILACAEEDAHRRLEEWRLHGEWFEPSDEVEAFVQRHLKGRPMTFVEYIRLVLDREIPPPDDDWAQIYGEWRCGKVA